MVRHPVTYILERRGCTWLLTVVYPERRSPQVTGIESISPELPERRRLEDPTRNCRLTLDKQARAKHTRGKSTSAVVRGGNMVSGCFGNVFLIQQPVRPESRRDGIRGELSYW